MTTTTLDAARDFVYREARLLERRLFATSFESADPAVVVDALRGYQNDDGGFGHSLEPDKRCPDSLPIDVEIAFQNLVAAEATDAEMVRRACDFLQSVSTPDGAVAVASPAIERYPRADEFAEWTYEPGLFPTAGLAGLLHRMGIDHPWVERATAWCWRALDDSLPTDAHALRETLLFLEHVPDRDRANGHAVAVVDHLASASWFRADPESPEYGVTPLDLVPTPDSAWRGLFSGGAIEGHLDRLERDQQDDGGWPLTWTPPSQAATLEYRGVVTVSALRTLRAYGRV